MKNYPDKRLKTLAKSKARALEAILAMESEVLADDLTSGHQDLIALYVSLISDFVGFTKWQIRQAAAAGVSTKGLRDAVRLGADLGDGNGLVSSILAVVTEQISLLKQ